MRSRHAEREPATPPRLNCKKFEARVIAEIRDHILTASNIRDLVRLIAEEMEGVQSDASLKLEAVEKELGDVRRSVERLWRAVEASDMEVGEILPRLRQQQSRQKSLGQTADDARAVIEERRALVANAETLGAYVSELGGLIESSDVAPARAFLRSFIKEIVVTSEAFTIHYTLPTQREGSADDEEEDSSPDSVRPPVPLGQPYCTPVRAAPMGQSGGVGDGVGRVGRGGTGRTPRGGIEQVRQGITAGVWSSMAQLDEAGASPTSSTR